MPFGNAVDCDKTRRSVKWRQVSAMRKLEVMIFVLVASIPYALGSSILSPVRPQAVERPLVEYHDGINGAFVRGAQFVSKAVNRSIPGSI